MGPTRFAPHGSDGDVAVALKDVEVATDRRRREGERLRQVIDRRLNAATEDVHDLRPCVLHATNLPEPVSAVNYCKRFYAINLYWVTYVRD